jgi:S1-C subfamily serine protease
MQSIGVRGTGSGAPPVSPRKLSAVDILDGVIILLAAGALLSGFRRGITWVGPSLAGLVAGIVLGAAVAPPLASVFSKQVEVQPLITTGIFLGIVLIVQGIGTTLGFRARTRALRTRFARIDSVLGAIVGVLGVLAGSWYLGLTFSQSPWTALDNQIRGSAIEQALDRIAPRPPGFLAQLENSLRNNRFPNPFSGLSPLAPPPAAIPPLVDTPGIRHATSVTSKVIAYGCGGAEAGSSWPIGADHVVTNAHVVAGSQRVEVDTTDGATHPAVVVLFDPDIDVAVLRVPGLGQAALPTASTDPARGVTGAVIGYPGGQNERVVPAAVRGTEVARGYNIYNSALVTRDIEVLAAQVIPGNSGGPLVDTSGVVQGLVFAASTTDPNEGYALTMPQIAGDLQSGRARTAQVATQQCTNG